MPSLTLIEGEAQRLLKRVEPDERQAMQAALVELCEAHWRQLRGPEPSTTLARSLWSVTPLWADLLIDLYLGGDARLAAIVPGHEPGRALALLVLAEIERGDEAGVQMSHEPMMAFAEMEPPLPWLERIASLPRGELEPPLLYPHDGHAPLWRALAAVAARTRRLDLPAVLEVISLLSKPAGPGDDEALQALRREVPEAGVRFLGVDDDHILLEQHGHAHKPVRKRRLGEMLLEIRRMWLG